MVPSGPRAIRAARVPRVAVPVLPAIPDRLTRASLQLGGYESHYVPTRAGRIHVLHARGRGRLAPMVLLHGFSASGVHYLPLLARLRPLARRVVAPDLPAHGFSDAPPAGLTSAALEGGLFDALDRVLDEPAYLIGNSLGGLAAIRYAVARPERARGLVLCSPGGAPMREDEIRELARAFHLATHADALDFVDRLFARPTRLRHLFAWGLRRQFAMPSMRALLGAMAPEQLLTPDELRSLRAPALLLWGKADRILPRAHLEFFRRHLPGAVVEEPPGFGHAPFLDDASALARRIGAFARAVERPAEPSASFALAR